MIRLLFILPGLMPPDSDKSLDKFFYLSEIAEGEALLPIARNSRKNVPQFLQETFPIHRVGRFRYHFCLSFRYPRFFRRLAIFVFYIRRGIQLHHEKGFDVIVAYGTNRPGVAGVILKWITGAKLVVEVPGVPENAFRYDSPHPGWHAGFKRFLSDQLLLCVGVAADCMKLLYPTQLEKYPRLQYKKAAVFHDFVPVHAISAIKCEEQSILLAGYPWFTKGVDLLIRAFKFIASEFPNYKLKLMGYYPDRRYLDELVAGCAQIEFVPPCYHEAALRIIGSCSVYVLASRTESMGRVLLEAMAARKPIIASNVCGVPHYIKSNDNGLLFQSENVEDLAAKLATVLDSPLLQARLSRRGYEKVITELDERAYVRSFQSMLDMVMGSPGGLNT